MRMHANAHITNPVDGCSPFHARLDVYEEEPFMAEGLAELKNAILVPHIGSATVETRTRMAVIAAENAIAAIKGLRPKMVVNPEVFGNAEE